MVFEGSPQTLAELGLDHVVEGTEFVVGKIQSKSIPAGGLGEGLMTVLLQ